MNDFDPGPGWRKVQYGADAEGQESLHWKETGLVGGQDHLWVREKPRPTEPGYYIDGDGCAWRLSEDGEWDDTFGNPPLPGSAEPKPPLERYELRRETAKAVLVMIQTNISDGQAWSEGVASRFGVLD